MSKTNHILILIPIFLACCSPKWGDKMVDEGLNKEAINKNEDAMKIYNRGVFFSRKSAELFWRRGDLNMEFGNFDKAMEDYNQGIEIDSVFSGGYIFASRAYLKEELGDLNGALVDYDKAISLTPEKSNWIYYRATLKYEMEDIEGCLDDLDLAISIWKNFISARLWRARIYVESEEYDIAMEDYKFWNPSLNSKKDLSNSKHFYYRGLAEYMTGYRKKACASLIISAPNDKRAEELYAKICENDI